MKKNKKIAKVMKRKSIPSVEAKPETVAKKTKPEAAVEEVIHADYHMAGSLKMCKVMWLKKEHIVRLGGVYAKENKPENTLIITDLKPVTEMKETAGRQIPKAVPGAFEFMAVLETPKGSMCSKEWIPIVDLFCRDYKLLRVMNEKELKEYTKKEDDMKTKEKKVLKAEKGTRGAGTLAGKKITFVAKECPFKSGTGRAKRFTLIKKGMTVEEALKAGLRGGHIRFFMDAELIKVGG